MIIVLTADDTVQEEFIVGTRLRTFVNDRIGLYVYFIFV